MWNDAIALGFIETLVLRIILIAPCKAGFFQMDKQFLSTPILKLFIFKFEHCPTTVGYGDFWQRA